MTRQVTDAWIASFRISVHRHRRMFQVRHGLARIMRHPRDAPGGTRDAGVRIFGNAAYVLAERVQSASHLGKRKARHQSSANPNIRTPAPRTVCGPNLPGIVNRPQATFAGSSATRAGPQEVSSGRSAFRFVPTTSGRVWLSTPDRVFFFFFFVSSFSPGAGK